MNKPRCYLELNTAAFAHNLQRVRELTPGAKVMAVIKADGYGHGMELAARYLEGADEFAVTTIADSKRLFAANIQKPITLLSGEYQADNLGWMQNNQIRPVVYDYQQLDVFRHCGDDVAVDVWLKIDTGMGRLGFSFDELPNVYQRLAAMPCINGISLMTHLANADTPARVENQAQFDLFAQIKAMIKEQGHIYQEYSVLNSAGVVAFSEQAADRVRPGLMLYGISPQAGASADQLGLQPVMSLKSSVISVRRMPAGSSIGYGGTYTLDIDSRIAQVACGYGDGYPRHVPTGTTVSINGFLVPLVGRVSMDMIAVDIGELPVKVGDEVILWGSENPVEEVAAAAGTIAYELTCGITTRVERITV